jgi:hypothetical protein
MFIPINLRNIVVSVVFYGWRVPIAGNYKRTQTMRGWSAPCFSRLIYTRIKKRRGFFSRVPGLMPSVLIRANYEKYIAYVCGRLLRQFRFCRCTQSNDPGRRLSAGLEGGRKGKSRNEWRLRGDSHVYATHHRWMALAFVTPRQGEQGSVSNRRSRSPRVGTIFRFRILDSLILDSP